MPCITINEDGSIPEQNEFGKCSVLLIMMHGIYA